MPLAQAVAQLPQKLGSFCVWTQTSSSFAFLHLVEPPTQSVTHAPAWQTLPLAQAVAQLPQKFGSLSRSTQISTVSPPIPPAPPTPPAPPIPPAPPGAGTVQSELPPTHAVTQLPDAQILPASQLVAQSPQWSASALVSTQMDPSTASHLVEPPMHSSAHAPPVQTSSVVHAVLHAPQCLRSRAVSTQTSLASASWHLLVPPAQVSAHTPWLHTLPSVQLALHAPQFSGSKRVSRHAPSHVVRPPGQLAAPPPPVVVLVLPPLPEVILSRSIGSSSSQPATRSEQPTRQSAARFEKNSMHGS